MRKILVTALILSSVIVSYAQVQEAWVARTRFSSLSAFDAGNDVVVDGAGNVYIVGTTEDPRFTIEDDFFGGMVTIKYDKNGNLIWKQRFTRVQLEGSSIAVDPSGNVYVMGFQYFRGSGGSPRSDFVTIKYNSLGEQQWQRSYDGPYERGRTGYLGLDAANNVYIAGTSHGEEDLTNEDPVPQTDYAVIKYDNAGNEKWVKRYNGAAPANRIDELRGMIVDPAGNVYVTGTSQQDGRIGTTTIMYNTAGTEVWVKRHNKSSNSRDEGNEIAWDLAGNIYVTGQFSDISGQGFETIKYSNEGVQQWASYYTIPDGFGKATSLVVDNAQNCYIVGSTQNKDIPGGTTRVVKYNGAGVQQWVSTYNSNPPSSLLGVIFQYDDLIANIAIGADANLYIATTSGRDFLTLKFNSSTGALMWDKRYDGPEGVFNNDNARSLWLDALDNVFVTGTSNKGTVGIFDFTT
ncbi:MAG TPA: SBBP repeat-containing protein, partial [Ferruginibacter sp.]|nr:SBBP repeat-containing protein [Ferruginibacter sp.]